MWHSFKSKMHPDQAETHTEGGSKPPAFAELITSPGFSLVERDQQGEGPCRKLFVRIFCKVDFDLQ